MAITAVAGIGFMLFSDEEATCLYPDRGTVRSCIIECDDVGLYRLGEGRV